MEVKYRRITSWRGNEPVLSNNAIVTVPYKLVGTIGKDIPVELGKIYGGTWSLIDYSEDYLKYQSDTGKEIELMCDY